MVGESAACVAASTQPGADDGRIGDEGMARDERVCATGEVRDREAAVCEIQEETEPEEEEEKQEEAGAALEEDDELEVHVNDSGCAKSEEGEEDEARAEAQGEWTAGVERQRE